MSMSDPVSDSEVDDYLEFPYIKDSKDKLYYEWPEESGDEGDRFYEEKIEATRIFEVDIWVKCGDEMRQKTEAPRRVKVEVPQNHARVNHPEYRMNVNCQPQIPDINSQSSAINIPQNTNSVIYGEISTPNEMEYQYLNSQCFPQPRMIFDDIEQQMNNFNGYPNMAVDYNFSFKSTGVAGMNPNPIIKKRIKKPLNAYMLYLRDVRAEVTREMPEHDITAIHKKAGEKWRKLTQPEKNVYFQKAEEEKERHREAYPDYNPRDYYNQRKRYKQQRQTMNNNLPFAKKCRAIYGVEQRESWCKNCKCKKRCLLYQDDSKDKDSYFIEGKPQNQWM